MEKSWEKTLWQKLFWFSCGLLLGFTALSLTKASMLIRGQVTDDTLIYQKLSEIRVKKSSKIDFDSSINRLSQLEKRYQENLSFIKYKTHKKRYVGISSFQVSSQKRH